jgi:hypothetical protein
MDIVTLGAGPASDTIAFRSRGALSAYDAVFIDLDAVLAEYQDHFEGEADDPALNVAGSSALLADARRWRDALTLFAADERVIVLGWTQSPLVRVHTLHDIVHFGVMDFFPLAKPRVEVMAAPQSLMVDCGEPFRRFMELLGVPDSSRYGVNLDRGEALLRYAAGTPGAAYRLTLASHLVVTPIAAGPDRNQRIHSALNWLGATLCSARHSQFLPAWTHRIELPGERELRETLGELEREARALRSRTEAARQELDALRGLKAIVAGSPAQAAAAASQRLRVLGANLLRDFEHENGFVIGADRGMTVLLAFAAAHDESAPTRLIAMRDRYRYEFDGDALPILVRQPTSDGRPVPIAPLSSTDLGAVCSASDFLQVLVDRPDSLAAKFVELVRQSAEQ